jgi:hypothetical protein
MAVALPIESAMLLRRFLLGPQEIRLHSADLTKPCASVQVRRSIQAMRAFRNGDNPSAMETVRNPPAAAQIIGRYPISSPRTPPTGAAMTIIARLIDLIVAFMRP